MVLAVPSCPMIKLDDKFYKLVDKMESLTEAPPSLIGAKNLTVKGPVKFVKGVVIKGNVTLENGKTVQKAFAAKLLRSMGMFCIVLAIDMLNLIAFLCTSCCIAH